MARAAVRHKVFPSLALLDEGLNKEIEAWLK
jgi:hypothetical protein